MSVAYEGLANSPETEAGLADDPRLLSMVQANLVTCLIQAGSHAEAQKRLPHAKALYELHGGDTDRLRLRWTGALLLQFEDALQLALSMQHVDGNLSGEIGRKRIHGWGRHRR